MRIIEIYGSLRVQISEEENTLREKIVLKERTYKKELSERENEVARGLVFKGVLNRLSDDEGIYFTIDELNFGRD
jgi:hypothetical protein